MKKLYFVRGNGALTEKCDLYSHPQVDHPKYKRFSSNSMILKSINTVIMFFTVALKGELKRLPNDLDPRIGRCPPP